MKTILLFCLLSTILVSCERTRGPHRIQDRIWQAHKIISVTPEHYSKSRILSSPTQGVTYAIRCQHVHTKKVIFFYHPQGGFEENDYIWVDWNPHLKRYTVVRLMHPQEIKNIHASGLQKVK